MFYPEEKHLWYTGPPCKQLPQIPTRFQEKKLVFHIFFPV